MNDEEFIIKFYSCDNQEQFLKDVYHNLNCLQNQVEKLTQENNDMEELLNKQYCEGLRQGKFDNEMEIINLKQINIDLQEENEYLNVSLMQKVKIIAELEKWLKEMLDSEKDIFSVIRVKDVLDKLNELRSKE